MNPPLIFQLVRNKLNAQLEQVIDSIDINILNDDGENLLHEAISSNNVYIAKILVAKKINVNHQDKTGNTPLHFLGEYPNEEIAQLILENGGDLSISNLFGNTPVWTMVFNAIGHYTLIDIIMKYRPIVDSKNKANKSPLDFAKQIKDDILITKLTS